MENCFSVYESVYKISSLVRDLGLVCHNSQGCRNRSKVPVLLYVYQ